MKYDPEDDKKVMVDASKLRYDAYVEVLHTKGNVEFGMSGRDSHIKHEKRPGVEETYGVVVNGSRFHANVSDAYLETTYIHCHTISCESDERLKKNVRSITNGLEQVSRLNPVTYNWMRDEDGVSLEYGFIAQEVEVNFPSLVTESKGSGNKCVDYMKCTSILAAALNELSEKVTDLTARVERVERRRTA